MLHPLALGSCLLLGLNDHYFKSSYPGFVTGKISDFAGLIFFPLLLVAVFEIIANWLGRPWPANRKILLWSIGITGLGFALINVVPVAGRVYEVIWGGLFSIATFSPISEAHHVVDPTDLIALPMLTVPWWLGTQRIRELEDLAGS